MHQVLLFSVLLISSPNYTFAQRYINSLSSEQLAELKEKSRSNTGFTCFQFPISGYNVLSFCYTDTVLSSEILDSAGNAIGPFYYYYDNGLLKGIKTYLQGCEDGTTVRYFQNGRIEYIGKMACTKRDTQSIAKHLVENYYTGGIDKVIVVLETYSVKNGHWHYFNRDGKLITEENWYYGKLLHKQEF